MVPIENMLDLPAIAFEDRRNLPDTPAVYFVLDGDNAVLYVGQSISIAQRWLQPRPARPTEEVPDGR
jgi:hypothetical protein